MSSETITRNDIVAILNKTIPGQGTDMSAQGVEDFIDDLNLGPSDYVKASEVANYVVEEGSAPGSAGGTWEYRKWSNGVAEAWRYWDGTASTDGSVLGGYYKSLEFNFPENFFTAAPSYAFASGKMGTGVSFVCARDTYINKVVVHILTNQSGSSTAIVRLYVRGTWK